MQSDTFNNSLKNQWTKGRKIKKKIFKLYTRKKRKKMQTKYYTFRRVREYYRTTFTYVNTSFLINILFKSTFFKLKMARNLQRSITVVLHIRPNIRLDRCMAYTQLVHQTYFSSRVLLIIVTASSSSSLCIRLLPYYNT